MAEKPELRLVPLERRHLDFMRGLRNDGRVNRWFASPAVPLSEAAQTAWYEDVYLRGGVHIFVLEADGVPVGYGQIKNVDHFHRSAEVGVAVAPERQRRGYGWLIVTSLLSICFKALRLHRVWLQVLSDNYGAIKLYEGCGFCKEGTLRHAAFKDGAFRDLVVMAVFSEQDDG